MRRFAPLVLALLTTVAAYGQQTLSPVKTSQPVLVLDTGGHSGKILGAAFAPDGRHVVTGSYDKTVRVWNISTGESVRVFRLPIGPGPEGIVHAIAVSPNGTTVAAGGVPADRALDDAPIYLLDLNSGQILRMLKGNKGFVNALAFSADGTRLASAGNRTIHVFDVRTGRVETNLEGLKPQIRHLAFSPDGRKLSAVAEDAGAWIWSLPDGKELASLRDGNRPTASVTWSPNGQTVAVGNKDGSISLWAPDGKLNRTIANLRGEVLDINFTADGRELLCTGYPDEKSRTDTGRAARLVDVATGKDRVRFALHTNRVHAGGLSPDGKLAISAGGNSNETFIWRTADGSLVQRLGGKGRGIWAVGWSPDGQSIAWGTTNTGNTWTGTALDETFHLANLELAGPPRVQFRRAELVRGMRSLEGKNFAMLIKQGDRIVRGIQPPGDGVYCFTWLPNGGVALGTAFGLFQVDPDTGQMVRAYRGHSGEVTAIALSPDGRRMVTGSNDQTVRIWDPEADTPLLSLFASDQEWVAWTEGGIYAASAGGERLMGWQINNGLESLGTFLPAAQFRKSLYHPEVVKHVVRAGDVRKAFAAANKDPRDALSVAQVLPPAVTITAPAGLGTLRVATSKFEVKATARSTGNQPVTALRLLVDGRPHGGLAGVHTVPQPKPGEVPANWTVELAPGIHQLAVLAESAVSRALSPAVTVSVAGRAPASELPALYVLAIGINDYPDPLRLSFAAPDADAISKALKQGGGKAFRTVDVKLLKDRQASKQGIEQALGWLASKMTAQDVGVFFFSGHGDRDDAGNFYLVPADVSLKDPRGSCLPGTFLKKALGEMPGRLIAVLDACHSGAAAGVARRPGQAADDLFRDLISEEYGVIVMSSSLSLQYSLESPEVKQGYFTLALVEGLAGLADTNGDGLVYPIELDGYTARRVRLLSDGRQNPTTMWPPAVRAFPLATVPPAAEPVRADKGIEALEAFDQATDLLWRQRYKEALPHLDKAIGLNVKMAVVYQQRGLCHLGLKNFEAAFKDADVALRLDPQFGPAYELRALTYQDMGRPREALGPYSEAARLLPNAPHIRLNRGQCSYSVGEYAKAIEELSAAIVLEPKLIKAYEFRAMCRNNRGDFDGALDDTAKALELNPRSAMAHGVRALVYAAQKKTAEADKELDLSLGLDQRVGQQFERSIYPAGRPKK
jgi:WD40 repeat protein/tetratricopeptide (TPR) repeat protein